MEIDESVFIADGAKVLCEDIKIGADCSIWYNAVVRCDDGEHVHIGDKTNIQDLCMVHTSPGRPTTIGKSVTIGHSCIIHGCTIGDNSLIGMGTILLDGAVIGKNCIIGAGSLVTKNTEIPDGSMAFGRPAKVVRELTEIEIMTNQGTAEWYVNEAGKHKNSQ
jgi:carbonic anhydrase/acetyltransferase-like protein (isoleucine patch superfamily)